MDKRDKFKLKGNTIAGTFRVDEVVAEGGFGIVYRAFHLHFRSPVALKCLKIPGELTGDERQLFLEQFRSEAEIQFRLSAALPHIVRPLHVDAIQTADGGFIPMMALEWLEGLSFETIIEQRAFAELPPMPLQEAMDLIGPAAEALHQAHNFESGEEKLAVIHRDIKPDNLLVTPGGQTKLADFGVARVPNAALTREGQFLGTPCYAAPETLARGQYGPTSDLFSFAAVLYEAAGGVRAFPGTDALEVANKVIHDEPVPLREVALEPQRIPKAVEAVIMRGLSKDVAARYGSAVELAEALHDAYLDSGVVTPADLSRPPSRRISTQHAAAHRPKSSLAFWAVLVGGLAVGIAFVFAFDEQGELPADLPDAGVDRRLDAGLVRERDAGAPDDAGALPLVVDAGVIDTGIDTGAPATPPAMTPHEREEAAKDALDRARDAIEDGDADAARTALEDARRFDPGNPDIAELTRRLDAL